MYILRFVNYVCKLSLYKSRWWFEKPCPNQDCLFYIYVYDIVVYLKDLICIFCSLDFWVKISENGLMNRNFADSTWNLVLFTNLLRTKHLRSYQEYGNLVTAESQWAFKLKYINSLKVLALTAMNSHTRSIKAKVSIFFGPD